MARRKIKPGEKKRKDALDPANDEFVEKSMSFLDWAYEHRRPVGLILGLALVVAIAAIITNRVLDSQRAEASKMLAEGLEAATAPVVSPSEDLPSAKDDDEDEKLTFETASARATDALKKFKEAAAKTSSFHKTFSLLGKASAESDLGQFDQAAAEYQNVLSSKAADQPWLKALALEGLGYALESEGKTDEAIKKFEEMGQINHPTAKNLSKYHMARLYSKKEDVEKAEKLFKEVVDFYADANEIDKLNYVFMQSRERLLALNPDAEVPEIPQSGFGGLEGMDPRILQQLMQAQSGGGLD